MADSLAGTLYHGDNLAILRRKIGDGTIDFVYLDPPFNSARRYRNKSRPGDDGLAFQDTWRWDEEAFQTLVKDERSRSTGELVGAFREILGDTALAAYLVMMAPRLVEFHRVLKPTGSMVLHVDPTASHYLKLLLDRVCGPSNYLNEIVWHYGGRGAKAVANRFGRNHDVLLYYAKNAGSHHFEKLFATKAMTHRQALARGCRQEDDGRWFKTAPRGDYTDASIQQLRKEGRIYETALGNVRVKYFLRSDDRFVYEEALLGDTWNDIPDAMHLGKERHGYPTQKPLALLERLISATTGEGDLVLDPFAGSGTTLVAAQKLGRKWIGVDSSEAAIAACRERLANLLPASEISPL